MDEVKRHLCRIDPLKVQQLLYDRYKDNPKVIAQMKADATKQTSDDRVEKRQREEKLDQMMTELVEDPEVIRLLSATKLEAARDAGTAVVFLGMAAWVGFMCYMVHPIEWWVLSGFCALMWTCIGVSGWFSGKAVKSWRSLKLIKQDLQNRRKIVEILKDSLSKHRR